MQTRREFIGAGCAALAGAAAAKSPAAVRPEPAFMWGVLLHFGVNIQCDLPVTQWGKYKGEDLKLMTAADHVRFDEGVFDRITDRMAAKGLNTIVMDLEEALYYPSHPELAVKGTWGVERFRRKLEQLRAKGLEPIPKLNFSTTHDIWLKEYHKMVSTPQYYRVCADVIADVIDIFDTPRYFHIGFDLRRSRHLTEHRTATPKRTFRRGRGPPYGKLCCKARGPARPVSPLARMLTAGSETPRRGLSAPLGAGRRLGQPWGLAGSPGGGARRPGGGASAPAQQVANASRSEVPPHEPQGWGFAETPGQAVGALPASRILRREACCRVGDCCAPGLPQEDAGGGGGERPFPGVGGRGRAGAAGAPGRGGPHGGRPAPRAPPELAPGPPTAADA